MPNFLTDHIDSIIYEIPMSLSELENHDLAKFQYAGEEKYVFVLDTSVDDALHGLDITHLPFDELVILMRASENLTPKQMYDNHLRNNRRIKNGKTYRIYKKDQISAVEALISKHQFVGKQSDAVIRKDDSLILTMDDTGHVSALDDRIMRLRLSREVEERGLYIPSENRDGIQEFLDELPVPKFVIPWKDRIKDSETPDEYNSRTASKFSSTVKSGGIILVRARDLLLFRKLGVDV